MEDQNKVIEAEVVESGGGEGAKSTSGAIIEQNGKMLNEKFVENAEKQIVLRQKLLMTGLKALKVHDFQDFDGKPYLEGEGAARIMAVVRGFKVGEAKFTVENLAPHYFVECSIPMEFMGATTVAIGDCSTADKFFEWRVKKYGENTGSETIATRLILGDAKKKARENAISRGVSELLGIKGLTWDDLEQLGFSRTKAGSSVKFKTGSQGGQTTGKVTLDGLATLPDGSKITISAKLDNAKEREVKTSKGLSIVTDYMVTEGECKVKISAWGKCIEDLATGDMVKFTDVTVKINGQYRNYVAESVIKEIGV